MLCRLATSILFCAFAGAAAADYTLTILHTNDVHARFEPINRFNSTCPEEDNIAGECFGGSARLASAIEEARANAINPVLFDGGDQFQGTIFYTYYKGQLTAEMMNQLGYDAMTVGNHEFDDGPEVLRGFMDTVNFPVLMSNADVSHEPQLAGRVLKSTVIERGGARLGLIGLTPEDTHESSSPGPNVVFLPPVEAVQAEVDRLTAEGVDKIIVLSHSGYGIDLKVARETTGVDVIVGGHSHTYLANEDPTAAGPYPTMVGETAVVQAYAYGKFLGRLVVEFDTRGHVISADGAPILMDAAVPEDQTIKARISEAAAPLDEIRNRGVGEAASEIGGDHTRCRITECQIGNLVADAMLERVQEQGIQIAIQNGGGLRENIDKGSITMGKLLAVLPFQNTLSTSRISGTRLLEALENGVSGIERGSGRFPQVAGIQFSIDLTASPGQRVRDVLVGGDPIDPDRLYGVVTNNYLRSGGDGYTMFREAEDAYDFGPDIADVVAEYLARHIPYEPYTDGRIRIVAE